MQGFISRHNYLFQKSFQREEVLAFFTEPPWLCTLSDSCKTTPHQSVKSYHIRKRAWTNTLSHDRHIWFKGIKRSTAY
eukprot:3799124-Rhodomonas_salina.2